MKFYSANTGGFYAPEIHGGAMPADAVEITDEQHAALLAGQSTGKRIAANASGHPVLVDPPAEPPAAAKSRLSAALDDLVAGIYTRFARFEQAYTAREAAARAFKAAGYAGDPGTWITGFATPAGLSLQAATDRIIAQADAMYAALPQLDALRMRKYEIAAVSDAGTAQTVYNEIAGKVLAIAAGL